MNFLKKLLFHTSAYVTAITTAVFIFAKIAGVSELTMTFRRYFLILLFSLLASSMENVFTLEKLSKLSKYALHYVTLATAFYFIFMNVRTSTGSAKFNFASVVASLIIFSVCYALFFIIKGRVDKSKKPLDPTLESKTKKPYKSMFK